MKTTVEYAGFAPNVATTIFTFTAPAGQPNQRCVIAALSLVDVSGSARSVNVRIVPAGETITDDDWCILPKTFAIEANGGVYLRDDPDHPRNVLIDGDRVVINADSASAVAARLCIGWLP